MDKFILSLDQGTTSSRCILFDDKCNIVSSDQREFKQIYPKAGWVEHDPMEIWASQIGVVHSAIELSNISAKQICAIGITNQRETTIVWNKNTGKPIYNAIVWQCRRTADICNEIIENGFEPMVLEKTGLVVDAYFSASKIKWILENVDGAMEEAVKGNLLFGTVDTWLIWNLTEGKSHVTDYTNASRTMLFNIHDKCWDEDLLKLFGIPKQMLPEALPSNSVFGKCTSISGAEIPITGVAGDQQAALFGQKCFEEGMAKNTYGTGSFMLMNTGSKMVKSSHGLITTIGIAIDNEVQYALEGSVFVCGAVIQWLRDEMELIRNADESEIYASKVRDTNGVYFVPAFTGLGAPYWKAEARGTITGITRGVNKNHIIRAALEAMAYQTMDIVKAMEDDSGTSLTSLKVDGGASKNKFLMQFQADILNKVVFRPECVESTALGAAYLAGLGAGIWGGLDDLAGFNINGKMFNPKMLVKKRNLLYNSWRKVVNNVAYNV